MKNLLTVGVFVLGFAAAAEADPVDQLIARYAFENNVNDVSGNGHHGTLIGGSAIYGLDASSGRSYIEFNGASRVEIADHDDLDLLGDWTIMYWIRRDFPLVNEHIVHKARSLHDSEGGYFVAHHPEENILAFVSYQNHNNKPLVVTTSGSEYWHHYAVTYSASDSRISTYIDGDLAGSRITDSVTANSYPLILGGYIAPDGSAQFSAVSAVADVRIYDATLSEDDLQFAQPIPEPGTYALFGMTLLAYGIYRRRRKAS